jgi:hypothetical protein
LPQRHGQVLAELLDEVAADARGYAALAVVELSLGRQRQRRRVPATRRHAAVPRSTFATPRHACLAIRIASIAAKVTEILP